MSLAVTTFPVAGVPTVTVIVSSTAVGALLGVLVKVNVAVSVPPLPSVKV